MSRNIRPLLVLRAGMIHLQPDQEGSQVGGKEKKIVRGKRTERTETKRQFKRKGKSSISSPSSSGLPINTLIFLSCDLGPVYQPSSTFFFQIIGHGFHNTARFDPEEKKEEERRMQGVGMGWTG